MINDRQGQLRTLIELYVRARIADSWKGSQPPQDVPQIELELGRARARLFDAINELPLKEQPK